MKASELVPSNSGTAWMGLILGRKTFQRPMKDGVELFNDTQDVYLRKEVTVA
jgi:class I fructose-bisphosphate aldolase